MAAVIFLKHPFWMY